MRDLTPARCIFSNDRMDNSAVYNLQEVVEVLHGGIVCGKGIKGEEQQISMALEATFRRKGLEL